MAKRFSFKLRLSRVFQSCRSKDPSTLPENPVPSFLRPPSSKPYGSSSLRRHVSSAILPCGSCSSRSSALHFSDDDPPVIRPRDYTWRKEDQWHVVAKIRDDDDENETPRKKIYNSSASAGDDTDEGDDVLVLPPLRTLRKTKRRSKYNKTTAAKLLLRLSTSSADSCMFSNEEEEEESETLVSSSRSISTDTSSDLNPHLLEPITEKKPTRPTKKGKKKKKRAKKKGAAAAKRSVSSSSVCVTPESGGASPARLSMFQKLIPCVVDGKVRESFAVVKKSEDPYEDFKRSMMEMIVEKKMFEAKDLEQLLHCFLSLNARDHHGVIVEAFTEIWQVMFCKNLSE